MQKNTIDTGRDPGLADLVGWTPRPLLRFPNSSTGGAAGRDAAAGRQGVCPTHAATHWPAHVDISATLMQSRCPQVLHMGSWNPSGRSSGTSLRKVPLQEIDVGLQSAWEAGMLLVPQWREVGPVEARPHMETGLSFSLTRDFTGCSCLHACFPHGSSSPRETLSWGETVGVESASGLPAVFLAIQQIHTTPYANTRKQ